jgi:diaminopimelate decarboxylase
LKDGEVSELNLGGGFGVAYTSGDKPMPIEVFADEIISAVNKTCKELGIVIPKLAFEPGRVIAGPAGVTLYTIGTTKDLELSDGAGSRKYVSVDGGMSDNARPALYGAEYTATLASRVSASGEVLARVVGKHCESGDIVVNHALLPDDLAVNDILAVATTGAYCYSLSSNYNYLTRPAMVSVSGGKAKLMIRAETESDLLARDEGLK